MNEQQPEHRGNTPSGAEAPRLHEDAGGQNTAGEIEPRAGPRIYVASLNDYVNGILHGAWLDPAVELDELEADVRAMLAASPTAQRDGLPAEEWAIHDYDGFGPVRVGEHDSLDWVTRLAAVVKDHGEAAAAWASLVGNDPGELERFEEAFLGHWDSAEAYAASLLDDFGLEQALDRAVPNGLRSYVRIDSEGFARDLQYGGDITVVDRPGGGVWIFTA